MPATLCHTISSCVERTRMVTYVWAACCRVVPESMPKQLHVPFGVFVEWLLPLNIDAAFGLEPQAYPSGSQVHHPHPLTLKHRYLCRPLSACRRAACPAAVQPYLALIIPLLVDH